MFPDIPYRFLGGLKRRFLRVTTRRWGWYRRKLRWLRPGAVWATDFTQPKARLWGRKGRLLLVRDLGSGAQLAAVACRGERAGVACSVFLALFSMLGAPLLLKHDRGGAFMAEATQEVLEEHGVISLASPPRTPQYNGAAERSGGTFKQRVEHVAMLESHPGEWTPENIDTALGLANLTARPFGATGPTPAEALMERTPVTAQARHAFRRAKAQAADHGLETFKEETGRMPTCSQRASIDRKATQHALCELGYLEIRRGRISTPISTWKAGVKA